MQIRWLPLSALLVSAIAWGSTVVVAKAAFVALPPLPLVALRLIITGLFLALVLVPKLRLRTTPIVRGSLLGLVLAAGLITQTLGLQFLAPSTTGFLTATYVVFTPLIIAYLWHKQQSGYLWFAVSLMVLGIGVLATGSHGTASDVVLGSALTLLSALLYAIHVVFLGHIVTRENLAGLTLMQAIAGTFAGLVLWFFVAEPLPADPMTWSQLLYLGLVCGGIVLLLQGWAQSHVSATPAALIMCSEPLWAALFAIAFGIEVLTLTMLIGGALVVVALILTVVFGATEDAVAETLHPVAASAP